MIARGSTVALRLIWSAIGLIVVLRAVAAFTLPLTGDEAYYWEWSRRLAFGYVDHPPAVAWTIAAFAWIGHAPGFVRLGFVVCGTVATLALAAATIEIAIDPYGGEKSLIAGAVAALALNLAPLPRDCGGTRNPPCEAVLVGLVNHATPDGKDAASAPGRI